MAIKKVNQKKHLASKDIKIRFRYKFIKKAKAIKINKTNKIETENLADKSTQIKMKFKKDNESTNETINKNTDKNASTFFENLENEYMYQFLNNHYDTYINTNFNKKLEYLDQKRIIMTSKVLNKFGLNEERRKYILNYFNIFIESNKINPKLYFSSATLFDSFLINFSESNNRQQCLNLFISKKTKDISDTRIIVLLFCCYYISAKFYGSNLLTINDLLKYPQAKDEFTYNEINNLITIIFVYTDFDLDFLNIYSFIEIYLFEIRRILKQSGLSNYLAFMRFLEKSVFFLGAKFGRNISLLNIEESIQGLGIIVFCYKLCKYKYQINSCLDMNLQKFFANLNVILIKYYKKDKMQTIFDWLNDNWNK